uniref:Tectonic-1-3 domain-containing protein n=1 Tax=Biomphalaria glabrata TaxID=6526 RepID=A0A2C9LV07_BIOGL
MRPSASGDCTTITGQTREPVLFGQDMRTGCFISINTTSTSSVCQELQQEIMNAIEGSDVPPLINGLYAKNNRYVAMFGNSEVTKTGDWVEIFFPNRPVPPSSSSSSCTLSLGANIQILYAKIGALPNPQPKIIGVSFIYDDVQQVVYQCTGPYCQPGSSSLLQKVEISSSVTFIDVSLSPQAVEGKYPTVAVRLPYDFFYPFLTSSGQCHPTFSQTSKFMIILLILTVWSIL